MKKNILSIALTLCLLLSVFTVYTAEEYVFAGFDPQDSYRDWETNKFFSRMEDISGVYLSFRQFTSEEDWQKELQSYLNKENLPDALFKAELTPAQTIALYESGVIIDLKPYLEEHAPNLYSLLKSNPNFLKAVTLPNGAIAALPHIDFLPMQNCLWVNTVWLEKLGLKMPTDLNSFEEMLKAFRDKDPNGNGSSDEIPLTFIGTYDLKFLSHAFGFIADDFNIYQEDGKALFAPKHKNFRDFIEWLHKLYKEKLIDKSGFTQADMLRRVTDAKSAKTYGVVITPIISQVLPNEWSNSYSVVPPLFYDGKQIYRELASPVTTGTFAITSECQNPEEVLKWVDYLYTLEGAVLASEGLIDEDYLIDGDGTWRKTQDAQSSAFLSETVITTGAVPPGITSTEFQKKYYDKDVLHLTEQMENLNHYTVEAFPALPLNFSQEQEIIPLQKAIGRAVDEQIARWIIGELEISDQSFEEFYNNLETLGLDKFMRFWQERLDEREESFL
ncbi:MAG: extracellular solute-binding protein [Eubacteriales bacterium]|nr:extracellular solute-binding protein [Eubacteriales bacterium]